MGIGKRAFRSMAAAMTAVLFIWGSTRSQTVKQNVLSFTGNVRAKMVWVRASNTANTDGLYNHEYITKLICYDSDENAERVLHDTTGSHSFPLITTSGEYVIWNNHQQKKSYIVKWDGTQKKQLLTGTNYYVVCSQWDDAARKEYVYAMNEGVRGAGPAYMEGTKLYRLELVNGTVNASAQTLVLDITTSWWQSTLKDNGEGKWFRAMPGLVSGDGKFFSANQPWPDIYVSDLTQANTGYKVSTGGGQSCWPQMAPDRSLRFFHLNQEHTSFHMYETYNTPNITDASKVRWIRVSTALPEAYGNRDLAAPRWSNHIKFFSVGFPLTGAHPTAEFCIGRFNDTWDSVKTIRITNGSGTATRNKVGDLWLASGEGPNKNTGVSHGSAPASLRSVIGTSVARNMISIAFNGAGPVTAILLDAAGRTVRTRAAEGAFVWDLPTIGLKSGTYLLTISTAIGNQSRKVVLHR